MKFSLNWLKSHLETSADVKEIADTLDRIGLEVEEIINPADNLKGFKIAQITTAEKHPNADRLKLLNVFDGTDNYQVVCGAPNAAAGLKGVFAKAGDIIPLYNEALKVGKIRDIESFGMMCSEKELLLSDNHDGIIELPADAVIGAGAETAFDVDVVFEINVTPNRAECLGVRGIARDLAAAGIGTLKPLNVPTIATNGACPVSIKIDDLKACSLYVGRVIKNVDNTKQSPEWLRQRLTSIGLRPISPLVDITNFINFDLAHPMHAFDADKLKGNINVRLASQGEKFIALDEKEYALDDKCLGICDDEGIQCLAGIMGGLSKGCSASTQNIFLESAVFDAENIARTGRKFGIESDSRYRYERFVDKTNASEVSNYATSLILEICGGQASDLFIAGSNDAKGAVATLRKDRIKNFIGLDVEAAKQKEILETLGFEVKDLGDKFEATTPSWRGDIECEADLVEEVLRMVGLDSVPMTPLPVVPNVAPLTELQKHTLEVKKTLAAKGLFETVTFSFGNSKVSQDFRKDQEPVMLINPISADLDEMRPSIIPNLLQGAKGNMAKSYNDVCIFEVGPEFFGPNPKEQKVVATGLRTGSTSAKHWAEKPRSFDVFDVKKDALDVIGAVNVGLKETAQIVAEAPSYYHPNRSGAIKLGKNVIAYFGDIHPTILKQLGIKQNVCCFEVYLENIPQAKGGKKKLESFTLQPVMKDLAFIVNKNVKAIDLMVSVKNADKKLITDVRVFDVFEGTGVEDGKKSVALALKLQPVDATLTDKDIEDLIFKVSSEVAKKTGGVLRDGS
ncbi:MAG: phenylalanine--tRNA ligase subunit beta [Alphaproteobacteria bacterium]